MLQPTAGLAFLAGFLSFISPCVLPLVPAYIGYIGGRLTHTVAAQTAVGGQFSPTLPVSARSRFVILLHGLAFVAGFTFIFVVLGLLATAFVVQIGRQNLSLIENLIARVGGVLVIFFGLHFMGVMPSLFNRLLSRERWISNPLLSLAFALLGGALIVWAFVDALLILPVLALFLLWLFLGGAFTQPARFWTDTLTRIQTALYSDTRVRMTASGQQNFASSAIMGVVFAAGWTPCIGPVYGAVLTMAANGGDVGQAGVLLGAYSLGLGVPFLLTALLLDSAQAAFRRIRRHMRAVEVVTGAFLIAIGVLVASGQMQRLSSTFAAQFTDLSVRVEECVLGFANGELPFGALGGCLSGEQETTGLPVETGAAAVEPASAGNNALALGTITGLAEGASDGEAAVYGADEGNYALNFPIRTVDNDEMMLADLRGKVVLLNFWATWCGPCRLEMPAFERAYQARADDGFSVLAVNNRETAEDIDDFRLEVNATFPLALDENGEIQRLYGVRQYPTTLLIDRAGVIRVRHVGPLTPQQIESLVSDALS